MKPYVVIGAGIAGVSTAYHLAKAGAEVIIIDREEPGQATNAAAGIVSPWLTQRRNKAWYQLVKQGAKFYPQLIQNLKEEGETETGYAQVGTLHLHTDEKKLEQMVERARMRREDAPEIGEAVQLSPEETNRLFPPLSEEYGAVHVSGGARVDGRRLRKALLRAAKRHGATFIEGDAVLSPIGQHVYGVQVNGEEIRAERVLITAGAWARELLTPLGLSFAVTSQRAQILHLELPGENTSGWPVVMPPSNHYLLSFEQGRIVAGATHEDEVGFDHRVTAGGVQDILNKTLTTAPGLADSTLVETRVGFRPFTPNFLPLIGEIPHYENLLVINGLGASGLTTGPYLGFQLAQLAMGAGCELAVDHYDPKAAINH
ncbi:NAD(P)/FAD-dependent oxidoreductase [Salsuginibacillus kocurii]|uniref:NAD(P)/FAD-dependent oxidoreductase n=1 Tax=Salsuginibacillus kocurii TaxID=427078 RepID=UPI00037EF109|nr:FAD-dependent oxidoreductase [Salsuginibacillus kocurii]